jgi:hypothetical protein
MRALEASPTQTEVNTHAIGRWGEELVTKFVYCPLYPSFLCLPFFLPPIRYIPNRHLRLKYPHDRVEWHNKDHESGSLNSHPITSSMNQTDHPILIYHLCICIGLPYDISVKQKNGTLKFLIEVITSIGITNGTKSDGLHLCR